MMTPRIPVLGRVLLTLLCCVAFSSAHAECSTHGRGATQRLNTPSVSWSNVATYTVTGVQYSLCERYNGGSWRIVGSGNRTFQNRPIGTYQYRQWHTPNCGGGSPHSGSASGGGYCPRSYSGVRTVAVTQILSGLNASENPSRDGHYKMALNVSVPISDLKLWEQKNGGNYQSVGMTITNRTNGTYRYKAVFKVCPPSLGYCVGGGSIESADITVDLDSPRTPTGISGDDISVGEVPLSWEHPGGPVIQSYQIQRNGHPVGSTSSTGYNDSQVPAGFYAYQVRACNNGGCSAWSDAHAVHVVGALQGIVSANTVGELSYQAGVNHKGQATASLTIPVMPGVNGQQPGLSISYNSGHEAKRFNQFLPPETLGLGWRVGGLSTIHSCGFQTTPGSAMYEGTCLDGEPLVRLSETDMTQYGLRDDDFSRIEIILLSPTTDDKTHWYRVTRADGTVLEYGPDNHSYAHRLFLDINSNERITRTWALRRSTDVFGNQISYRYHKSSGSIPYIRDIEYGPNNDSRIDFYYDVRSIPDPNMIFPLGAPPAMVNSYVNLAAQQQPVLLKGIQISHHGVPVRDMRFASEVTTGGHEQVKQIQQCAYDASGTVPSCLAPLQISWHEQSMPPYRRVVQQIEDSVGVKTRFDYLTMKENQAIGQYSERPFSGIGDGNVQPLVDTRDDDELNTVVTQLKRSNGVGGWLTTEYAYQGIGRQQGADGFQGFDAMRIHEPATGITTYRAYDLWAQTAKVKHEYRYQGFYPGGQRLSQTISTHEVLPLERGVMQSGGNTNGLGSYYDHTPKQTNYIYREGQLIGVVQSTNTLTWANHLISRSISQTQWADRADSNQTLSGVYRTQHTQTDYTHNNTNANWLIGFAHRTENKQYSGASTLEQHQVQTATQYLKGARPTALTQSTTAFPGDAQLELTNRFSYDSAGRLLSTTQSGQNVASRTNSIVSYADGRYPELLQNAYNHSLGSDYDGRFGLATRITDANNLSTTVDYDNFGRETSRTTPDGYSITTDIANCNEVSCPSVNGITATTRIQISSPVSPTSTQYIDALGRTLRTSTVGFNGSEIYQDTHYNSLGQVFRTSLPYFANALPVYTTTTYDDLGRVSQVERPDTSVVNRSYGVDISQHLAITTTTETVLDHNGAVVNSKAHISRSHYSGDLHSTTDAVGTPEEVSTHFDYYGTGLPKTIHVNTEQVASFTYDAAGHRTLLSDANVGTINTQYTALGQVRWQQDSAGNIATTGYDLLGRPTSEVTADGTASWFYDPANAIGGLDHSQFTDARTDYSTLTQLTYNTDAKLTDTAVTLNVPGYTRHYGQDLSYDGFGRLSTASYPSGVTLRQDYTALGYLQQVSNDANSEALSKTVTVNALGHVTEHAFGNGITTARHYDPKTGRLTGIDTQDISNNLLQNNTYQWQSDGLLTQRTNNIVSSKVETFTYDALNRLQDAITQAGGIGRTASTRYALNGNIESKTSSDGSDNISGYQYGNNAGPHAVSAVNINGIAHTLTYNANGAITHYDAASGDDRYIDWTARGKPETITQGDSASDATPTARDEFAYGESGLRYYKKSSWDDSGTHRTEHTFYVGNFEDIIPGNDPLYTRIEKTRLGQSIMHLRLTDATTTTERFEYLHRDHLGSVEAVTDENGNTLMSFAFEAFGARRKTDWTGLPDSAETQAMLDELHRHTSRGYTDHEHLDRTGLIHMNGRVYDPVIGRFLSPDPFVQAPGYSQSYNRYSYVWNNPLGMTDPTGYFGSAGGAADARSSTPGGTFGRDGNRPKFKLSLGRLVSQAGSGRGRIAGVDGSNPASGRSTVSGVVTSGTWNGDKKELTITGKVFNNISIEAFVNAMISGAEAGSLVNNQGGKHGSFEWAKEQLVAKGLVPGEILNDPSKLIDATNVSAVQNIKSGALRDGLTTKAAAALVASGVWQDVAGTHQNGVMTIYAAATQPFFESHTGINGMQLTGPQNLVQTIYHEYMHYSGVRDHGSNRGSFEYNSWGRKEGRALRGWINDL